MKYMILATAVPMGENTGLVYEDEPQKALMTWFRYSQKYPTCVAIQPETKEDGLALLEWAHHNPDQLDIWAKEYRCPYKIEWLKEQIAEQFKEKRCSMQWNYDQLFPFCMG